LRGDRKLQADLICIGNELLTGLIENSNSGYLARKLWSTGIPVRESIVVADEIKSIKNAIDRALLESDLIILTGGLGPTDDDLTREAVAAALGLPLVEDRLWLEKMEHFFRKRGIAMPLNNRKQAQILDGGRLLKNKYGTAPGQIIEIEGRIIVLLPGPPHELKIIFEEEVLPYLLNNNQGIQTKVKTIKCFGIGESLLEEKIKEIGNAALSTISYVARGYEVDLQIKGKGTSLQIEKSIGEAEKGLLEKLGDFIIGNDEDTLPGIVADLFIANNLTLAIAESCSGGLLSDLITDIPGCSKYYKGGLIAYNRDIKKNILGLEAEMLDREGEVSATTAEEMAKKAMLLFGADYGIGITGLAGPDKANSNEPVGLVYIAACSSSELILKRLELSGGRRTVKERASYYALDLVRKMVKKYLPEE
jgi:nicotinamide-nucleotide amidase